MPEPKSTKKRKQPDVATSSIVDDDSKLTASALLKSAYEIAREENIRKNNEVLASLGLAISTTGDASSSLLLGLDRDKAKTKKNKPKRKIRKVVSEPTRRSDRQLGVAAPVIATAQHRELTEEEKLVYLKRLETTSEERKRKYDRLMERHANEGLELPKNASYAHTVKRVLSMSEAALSRRVRVMENAQGMYAPIKMQQFAEVLIMEGYEALAAEANAALQRLLELPKFKGRNWSQLLEQASKKQKK